MLGSYVKWGIQIKICRSLIQSPNDRLQAVGFWKTTSNYSIRSCKSVRFVLSSYGIDRGCIIIRLIPESEAYTFNTLTRLLVDRCAVKSRCQWNSYKLKRRIYT